MRYLLTIILSLIATVSFAVTPQSFNGVAGGLAGSPNITVGTIAATSVNFGGSTLAYYQEGTFTPILSFGTGTTGITYTGQVGTYTRVGNRVHFQITLLLSNKGNATGEVAVTNLPFTSSSTANNWVAVTGSLGNVSSGLTQPISFLIFPGTTTIQWYKTVGGAFSYVTDADMLYNSQITLTGTYQI